MATLRLPVDTAKRFPIHLYDLDGRRFRFEWKFNEREDRWYFDCYDAAGTLIRPGVKVVLNTPLMRIEADVNKPAGTIVAIDTTGSGVEPGRDDLDDRVILAYLEADS